MSVMARQHCLLCLRHSGSFRPFQVKQDGMSEMGSHGGGMDEVRIYVFSLAGLIANSGCDSSPTGSPALGATIAELDVSDAKLVVTKTKFSMTSSRATFALQMALDLLENRIDVHVLADGVSSVNHPEIEPYEASWRERHNL
ncbi:hypothetical protein BC938DRAFT_478105 [Jimgerdemannia flammicorona]|uniref:Uncharacterized protein n=1 Tax=Jimgerdemannia flammicorona TaxID=994334 RepID=A0A433QND8_9FUNG|nr:hypothetical protein BC938DRAFT_478105 [Jimgerdemannia flammicorona]